MRTQLHHLIEQRAGIRPDAPAITYRRETLSYGDLWDDVSRIAGGLQSLGVERDDRVAVYLEKRIETVTAIFAASRAGGVFVPINPVLRARQVAYIMADCDVKVLVTSSDRLALLADELEACPALRHVVLVDGPPTALLAGRPDIAVSGWDDLAGDGSAVVVPKIDIDMASILYTSGSTGSPKGVVLTHRNMIVGAESVSSYIGNHDQDVILSALPLSFDAGFSQLTTAFAVGAHVVLMNYMLAGEVVQLCARHQVTGLTCVPPLWIQIADRDWPAEASQSMRYFANTGGRMPKATLDKLRGHFPNARPFLMYGLTEAFRSTYLDPDEVDRRPDSIGKAIPNAEILVVRPDGTRCGPGEEGELVHRGALVAVGYWNDPVRTAERFKPAPGPSVTGHTTEIAVWSGDAVVADEEGFLYFVGRKDDMIKTSGYRVSPTEIEEVAYASGLVRDAVALGQEDERLGQVVVLVVSPAGEGFSTDALLDEMRRQLPLYMVPSSVVVRDELPRSPNGKFDRNLIRSELAG
jgi:acyl-CoA ligase (AMP-forming) (exosortase A-associated)